MVSPVQWTGARTSVSMLLALPGSTRGTTAALQPPHTQMWQRIIVTTSVVMLTIAVTLLGRPASAAEISARDVTQQLFKASVQEPVDFSDMDLSFLDLAKLDFKKAKLVGADLYGADLSGTNLRNVDLSETRLDRAALAGADLTGANLSNASLLRANLYSTLSFGHGQTPLMRRVNLDDARIIARMDGTDFFGSTLRRADFSPMQERRDLIATAAISQLVACDFSETDMRAANLMRAKLVYAKFRKADLRGVNFQEADLSRADFTGADVTGANFAGANLDGAIVANVKGVSAMTGAKVVQNTETIAK